jgi:hypothetical protein
MTRSILPAGLDSYTRNSACSCLLATFADRLEFDVALKDVPDRLGFRFVDDKFPVFDVIAQ